MMILALEFSAAERSVALAVEGRVLAEARETGPRGTNAFGLISRVLSEAGARREDLHTLAVGLGPGSYTGIRVAVAVAQGWQLARPVRLRGVEAVTTLTTQAQAAGIFGRVKVLIDAQRGEFYRAVWELTATERREVTPLHLVPVADLKPGDEDIYLGPDVGRFGGRVMMPTAATVAQLAAQFPVPGVRETLEPVYLRESTFVKWQPTLAPGVVGI